MRAHKQVWVYGNSFKSSLVAVVVPKPEAIKEWAKGAGKTGECVCSIERERDGYRVTTVAVRQHSQRALQSHNPATVSTTQRCRAHTAGLDLKAYPSSHGFASQHNHPAICMAVCSTCSCTCGGLLLATVAANAHTAAAALCADAYGQRSQPLWPATARRRSSSSSRRCTVPLLLPPCALMRTLPRAHH
jgi:hypothetical protein